MQIVSITVTKKSKNEQMDSNVSCNKNCSFSPALLHRVSIFLSAEKKNIEIKPTLATPYFFNIASSAPY